MKPYHSVYFRLFQGSSQDMLAWEFLTELSRTRGCSCKRIMVEALIHYGRSLDDINKMTCDEKALAEKFGRSIVEAVKEELAKTQPLTFAVPVTSAAESRPDERQSVAESEEESTNVNLADVDWDFLGMNGG